MTEPPVEERREEPFLPVMARECTVTDALAHALERNAPGVAVAFDGRYLAYPVVRLATAMERGKGMSALGDMKGVLIDYRLPPMPARPLPPAMRHLRFRVDPDPNRFFGGTPTQIQMVSPVYMCPDPYCDSETASSDIICDVHDPIRFVKVG